MNSYNLNTQEADFSLLEYGADTQGTDYEFSGFTGSQRSTVFDSSALSLDGLSITSESQTQTQSELSQSQFPQLSQDPTISAGRVKSPTQTEQDLDGDQDVEDQYEEDRLTETEQELPAHACR